MIWRRARPGTVKLRSRAYIALLQCESRAHVLEAEQRDLLTAQRRLRRESRAQELAAERAAGAEVSLTGLEVDGLMQELPITVDGSLHETAFIALLDQLIWQRRLARLDA